MSFQVSEEIYWPILIANLIFETFSKTKFSPVINLKIWNLLTVFTESSSNDANEKLIDNFVKF